MVAADEELSVKEEWDQWKLIMTDSSIVIEVLVNSICFIPTLIDTGCECYATIDSNLVYKLKLSYILIKAYKIKEFVNSLKPKVNIIT